MKKSWTITLIFLAINLFCCKHENVESGMQDDELVTVSPEFEKYLIESKIDPNPISDGKISYGAIKEIDSLTITLPGNHNSLKGLEYFTNLKYLKYNGFQNPTNTTNQYYYAFGAGVVSDYIPSIDTLDVSRNLNLEYLDCSGRSDGGGYSSCIGNLKLGKNEKLQSVIAKQSMLKSIDLSGLPNLKNLDLRECYNLSTVSICSNKKLDTLRSWQVKKFYVASLLLTKPTWITGAANFSECK